MATVQVLKVAHRVEDGVKSIGDEIKGVDDNVKGVDDNVKGVDDKLILVDDKVNVAIECALSTLLTNATVLDRSVGQSRFVTVLFWKFRNSARPAWVFASACV